MGDMHAPDDGFVARLEAEIGREIRRRHASQTTSGWLPHFDLRTIAALGAVVLVSMAVGGGVVAAAYQAQTNEQRDALSAAYARRLKVARQQVALAEKAMRAAEQQHQVGLANRVSVREVEARFGETQAAVKVLELDIAEIRATAREPQREVSSPLVSGRDFVTERWLVEIDALKRSLGLEQVRLTDVRHRLEIGLVAPTAVADVETRLAEVQAGVHAFDRKIGIRRQFVKGEVDAAMAELRVIESNTGQRRHALTIRVAAAQATVDRIKSLIEVGRSSPVERMEAEAELLRLRADLASADVELALVQQQIAQRKGK